MAFEPTGISSASELSELAHASAERCGVVHKRIAGGIKLNSPINGQHLFSLDWAGAAAVEGAIDRAHGAFRQWRKVPAPVRADVVKGFGRLLTEHKNDLATLISLEVGKITSEARGEVQEMIDICDFAVGISRQLYGRTMTSERPGHRLMETWHPLGVVAVISAFNFPSAVSGHGTPQSRWSAVTPSSGSLPSWPH